MVSLEKSVGKARHAVPSKVQLRRYSDAARDRAEEREGLCKERVKCLSRVKDIYSFRRRTTERSESYNNLLRIATGTESVQESERE